ncbi:MAG TPA: hypothetical protein VG054_03980 [Acidimicrobiales bacterium]|nr:hypothetical protein [Acidimicrobiales bacterium]
MSASMWVPIVASMLLFLGVVMAAGVFAAYLLWRYGRRKWRAFHSHGLVIGALALWDATRSGHLRARAPAESEHMHQWTARRVRKEMWRSVDQADAAVRAATRVGAPTASLPSLCHRLQDAAVGLDQVLRVESAGVVPVEVADQATEVMKAAADVQRAAVASAADINGQRVRVLAHDADLELQCLDAGLQSVKAALPHPQR